MPSAQARYWILTIPNYAYLPYLPPACVWIRGQLERGNDRAYLHWQLCVLFAQKIRLRAVKNVFGDLCHAEPTRSERAVDYVWKDDTAVEGTRFELGSRPVNRNNEKDWDRMLAIVFAKRTRAKPEVGRGRSPSDLPQLRLSL